MSLSVKNVASGEVPLTVAFAEEAKSEEVEQGSPYYSTYTTESGSSKSLDDAPIKDED